MLSRLNPDLEHQSVNTPEAILELDEKLTRYWLNTPLTLSKRIEMEQHLQKILDRRLGGVRKIETNA